MVPPWETVYQQTQRWLKAGVFDAIVHDLRVLLRWLQGRADQPTATMQDSRTLRSTPERGHRAGYDGRKRKQGSKLHAAVDTLGELTAAVQEATGDHVEVAVVEQGYTGQRATDAATAHGIDLIVVKLEEAKRGFVLLPRRWVIERDFAWATQFRRLVRDDERLPETVAGLHLVAFAYLMLHRLLTLAAQSP